VNSVSLEKQLKAKVEAIALPNLWAEIIKAEMESMMRKEVKEQHSFSQNLEHRINDLDKRIDKLINTYLEGLISKEAFPKKKNELLERKVELHERLDDFGKRDWSGSNRSGSGWRLLSRLESWPPLRVFPRLNTLSEKSGRTAACWTGRFILKYLSHIV
jgi:predicted DNA-binding protein